MTTPLRSCVVLKGVTQPHDPLRIAEAFEPLADQQLIIRRTKCEAMLPTGAGMHPECDDASESGATVHRKSQQTYEHLPIICSCMRTEYTYTVKAMRGAALRSERVMLRPSCTLCYYDTRFYTVCGRRQNSSALQRATSLRLDYASGHYCDSNASGS